MVPCFACWGGVVSSRHARISILAQRRLLSQTEVWLFDKDTSDFGLKCLKHGTVRWDDTKEVMVVPKTAASVREHLENGVFAMVIDKQAYLDSEDHLISIMLSGNLEQSVAIPEHEIALCRRCCHSPAVLFLRGSVHGSTCKKLCNHWQERGGKMQICCKFTILRWWPVPNRLTC